MNNHKVMDFVTGNKVNFRLFLKVRLAKDISYIKISKNYSFELSIQYEKTMISSTYHVENVCIHNLFLADTGYITLVGFCGEFEENELSSL